MIEQTQCRNLLLRSLNEGDFDLIAGYLEPVDLSGNQILASPGKPIAEVFFIETGIATYSEVGSRARIGIAHVGFEGMSGWSVLLGDDLSTDEARMSAFGGTAHRMSPGELLAACEASTGLSKTLLRFVRVLLVQLGRTITSSLTQSVDERLCRWTLMAHDRVEGDRILVTHEEIAVMLAVRRATITDLLHMLEGEGLIRSERGKVFVLDRAGLKRRAGAAYGFYESEYSRLIQPFPV